ncbi:two-component sensor histidine kinase [Terrihabitans soli]|uniref:histidine kinase n=1 Tax=Terrihabitans soli TaxID=708113 RepID=A0A6S6QT49_9HYPH|nr:ATP-binding protein [Terrihabitans soli]BCJ90120.1 two-component sensor histidine kinase [Terrihabitans soli]
MTAPVHTARTPVQRERSRWRLGAIMPKGLYTRSLLIVVLPMLLLQSVVALVFMERHWELTTQRLSQAVAQDISAIIDLYSELRDPDDRRKLTEIASRELGLDISFLPNQALPAPKSAPLFFILDRVLSEEIAQRTDRPFSVDSQSEPRRVEVQVKLENEILRVRTRIGRAYASNSHIFLVWMVVASAILIAVSILFLRNQIKPILHLANAAENLGKGRDVADFTPRGAAEVRRATQAFFAMRDRIHRQIEQRTTMLAGVSHDLRTVLTRLRLQIALMKGKETQDLEADIDEMERMLEGYLAFARGDAGETAKPLDIASLLDEIGSDAERTGKSISVEFEGPPVVTARPDALKRAITNLVINASRFGGTVKVEGRHEKAQLVVTVDDDGPGIPGDKYEEVFRPFLRLDEARNLDHPGSGLGLTIARDIARGHGGDVILSKSPLGGLRAQFSIPV